MTYEEALNFGQKWTEEQAFNDLERYLLREEPPAMKAVAICMRAAKKQIPKRANGGTHAGYCPDCKTIVFADQNFCPHCGQALDWSDAE